MARDNTYECIKCRKPIKVGGWFSFGDDHYKCDNCKTVVHTGCVVVEGLIFKDYCCPKCGHVLA